MHSLDDVQFSVRTFVLDNLPQRHAAGWVVKDAFAPVPATARALLFFGWSVFTKQNHCRYHREERRSAHYNHLYAAPSKEPHAGRVSEQGGGCIYIATPYLKPATFFFLKKSVQSDS